MFLYRIVNVLNNKVYIGITTNSNPLRRWTQHQSRLRKGTHNSHHLQRAWNKYGNDAFVFEVVKSYEDLSELKRAEAALISDVDATNIEFGYNLTLGGEGRIFTDEIKQRLSVAAKRGYDAGRIHPFKGGSCPLSDEGRKALSNGCKSRMTGLAKSAEQRRKMSESASKSWTPERRAKMSVTMKLYRQNKRTENVHD